MSVFKLFNPTTDIVTSTRESTSPMWGGNATVQCIDASVKWYTGSQATMSDGYIPVYDGVSSTASHLFDVFYANYTGAAGCTSGNDVIMYKTLATRLLGSYSAIYEIDGSSSRVLVGYVFPREHFKDRLDPGNWQITLSASNDDTKFPTIVDDSDISSGTYTSLGLRGNIRSGTIAGGSLTASGMGGIIGHVYYDLGLLVINPSNSIVAAAYTGATGYLSGAAVLSGTDKIQARSLSKLQSAHYYCRSFNSEFNFSNNPTFADESNGNLRWTEMYNDPYTYISTIGLYNLDNELIAIGKLSQPIEKSFNQENIITARLDF